MSMSVQAPLAGTVVPLEQVPDPVFAQQIIGPGLGIMPCCHPGSTVTAVSPVTGRIAKVHPHAFVVVTEDGHAVLVHLGLDTVSLKGEGFTVQVCDGDHVQAGDAVVTWSPAWVRSLGLSPVVPVIALEAKEGAVEMTAPAEVTAGDEVLTWS